jgi:hypothetical protein
VSDVLKGKNKRQFKGRTYLSPLNQLDWDDEPTIYQAASVAHGHLLHFKQEWLPDGYSIGDIIYFIAISTWTEKTDCSVGLGTTRKCGKFSAARL